MINIHRSRKAEIIERLKLIIEENEGVLNALAELDIGETTLRSWLRGTVNPSVAGIINICEVYNVSADWLLFGEGEMHL